MSAALIVAGCLSSDAALLPVTRTSHPSEAAEAEVAFPVRTPRA